MPDNYHLIPCAVCEGYNHECTHCNGFGEVWACDGCNGDGLAKVWGEQVYFPSYKEEYPKQPVPCPQCNGKPIIKIDGE